MTTRTTLRLLVDELPEDELTAAARFLEYLRNTYEDDPVLRMLDEAPEDDEPATPEEEAAVTESSAAYRRGESRPWEEVRKELGGE